MDVDNDGISRGEGKKKRSVVWNHFNIVHVEDGSAEFAYCKYCQAKYKCSENGKNLGTSNLMDHLKEKHQEVQLNLKDENSTEFVNFFHTKVLFVKTLYVFLM